ncbi:MAG TPA: hypothetical protein VFK52_12695 [Nocardioidaceae bacterium]|nr:hypothetical protein [Nocardioidaceae bacterium]
MVAKLFLHIGLAKTGTTFLQAVLAENRPRLREAGFIYPYVRNEGMFHAAVEVRREYDRWGLPATEIDGTFDALVTKARDFGGTAVISHEILAGADADQVAWVADRLDGFEVHLVVTVRDLARLLPAHWAEAVKNGHSVSFADLTREVLREPDAPDTVFWASHDLGAILERWATIVPPDRVHVVVAPPRGADKDELFRRFASAIGLPDGAVDTEVDKPANESLGVAEIHLLRQINSELDGSIPQPYYSRVVKRLFAQRLLGDLRSPRVLTPEQLREPLTTIAQSWVDQIRSAGYVVHGELDELLPTEFGTTDPDDQGRPVLPGTLAVFSAALREVAALRAEADSAVAPQEAGSEQKPRRKRFLRRR